MSGRVIALVSRREIRSLWFDKILHKAVEEGCLVFTFSVVFLSSGDKSLRGRFLTGFPVRIYYHVLSLCRLKHRSQAEAVTGHSLPQTVLQLRSGGGYKGPCPVAFLCKAPEKVLNQLSPRYNEIRHISQLPESGGYVAKSVFTWKENAVIAEVHNTYPGRLLSHALLIGGCHPPVLGP